ncbi:glycosyltransferase family 4 protein [Chelativorans sp. YIM 93263]|uniref:glycosyltransferase family 4 protein n=1 Tax=Chelativorans sp. YIM 93263 TaxID=2906648 RepID=UPI0023799539|nr:glycosyltransferase family 4 protein [Chelativorans sp. YIM 93263]
MALTVLSVAYPFAAVGRDAVGGAEQVLSALDQILVRHGHRSLVIACEGSSVAGELIPLRVQDGPIDDPLRDVVWAEMRELIASVLAKHRVDLVHLHGIDFPAYVPEDAPTLATLHLPLDWYPEWIYRGYPNLWLHCVSEAQHHTAPEGAALLPPIENGVPRELFETNEGKSDHAIALSRICPEKGIHLALQACRRIDQPLVIGGQVFPYEAHQRYFREEVAPLLDERRRFLGPLGFDQKRQLLASARCVLIPSLVAETCSLTAIEALACGTPVVAFPNGALPEVVEHGRTGFIVNDVHEMADAISACSDIDPEVCRSAAADRFSPDRMEQNYLELYHRIADARAAPAKMTAIPY